MHPCTLQREGPAIRVLTHHSHWCDDGTCSYCGSINNDEFMRLVETSECELEATDKDYKVYVWDADPQVGVPRIFGMTNSADQPRGWTPVADVDPVLLTKHRVSEHTTFVSIEPTPARRMRKFYFEHLSAEQRRRFVELMNAKRLRFNGGGFYVLPFFCVREIGAKP